MLELRKLRAGYGTFEVLHDIDLQIADRSIVALVGHNGAGKSTLMKAAFGVVPVAGGTVVFDAADTTRGKPFDKCSAGIRLVPQEGNVFFGLTIEDNLRLGALKLPGGRDKVDSRIGDIFDIFPILKQTALDTALVMFIIAMASGFGYLMAISGLPRATAAWISSITTNPLGILMAINVLLLIVGCFMEAIAALLILVPVLVPVVQAVGIDLTHFGLVMVFNLMLGLLTPPVGILLYICANFAEVKLEDEIREVMPFLAMGLVVLFLITVFPELVLWVPRFVLGSV